MHTNHISGNGTIKDILPVEGGTSRAGNPWRKQRVIIEIEEGNAVADIAMTAINDRVDDTERQRIGAKVYFSAFVKSREYQGRWYTDVELSNIGPEKVSNEDYIRERNAREAEQARANYAARQAARQAVQPQQEQIFPQPQYQAPQPQMFAPPIVTEAQAQPNPDDLPF